MIRDVLKEIRDVPLFSELFSEQDVFCSVAVFSHRLQYNPSSNTHSQKIDSLRLRHREYDVQITSVLGI